MTEQYWNKNGIVNQESIGYLKPVSVVTSEMLTNGIPSSFRNIYEKIFGGIPSEELFVAIPR